MIERVQQAYASNKRTRLVSEEVFCGEESLFPARELRHDADLDVKEV